MGRKQKIQQCWQHPHAVNSATFWDITSRDFSVYVQSILILFAALRNAVCILWFEYLLSVVEQSTKAIGCQLDLLEGDSASVELLTIQLTYGNLVIKTKEKINEETKYQKTNLNLTQKFSRALYIILENSGSGSFCCKYCSLNLRCRSKDMLCNSALSNPNYWESWFVIDIKLGIN